MVQADSRPAKKSLVGARRRQKLLAGIRGTLIKLILFIMLLGFAYVILYPFLFKIMASFMSEQDLYDPMVSLVPRDWTLDNYRTALGMDNFSAAAFNTVLYAVVVACCATASSALIGYGLARFRFPGSRLIAVLVVLTMMTPIQTISLPLFSTFRFFDVFGIIEAVRGEALQLTNTIWPMVILSATGLGFRAGMFIILMRQYYKSIPGELVEAAYVDGAGPFYTFFRMILPMARTMMVVVFVLSFAWQWTDTFYTGLLMGGQPMLPNLILTMCTGSGDNSQMYYQYVLANTAALLTIIPLLLIYVLLQRKIIQGIETSGLVG